MRPIPRRKPRSVDGDPLIPILNIVCLLIPLLLYGAVFVRFTTLNVSPPKIDPGPENTEPDKDLRLTVMATDRGFHFKVNPEFRQSWMTAAGSVDGPDIPKRDDGWDFAALKQKLEDIKRDHNKETRIILGAEDDIPFDVLIKMMDASRGSDSSPLFPNVTLTRGVV